MLPALTGASRTGRRYLVEQASALSLRDGAWKYIPPTPGDAVLPNVHIESGQSPDPQLYDLSSDPGERTNLASRHPERVREMARTLEEVRRQSN